MHPERTPPALELVVRGGVQGSLGRGYHLGQMIQEHLRSDAHPCLILDRWAVPRSGRVVLLGTGFSSLVP